MENKITKNKKILAYYLIIIVVFIWGVSPPLNVVLNKSYSPTFRTMIMGIVAASFFTILSFKKLKEFNVSYLKVAVPTGVFLSLATFIQKIGLLYTTPTKYAFLENLSVVVVPIILFVATKKKPPILTIISCIACLVGSFVLTGMASNNSSSFGIGEILCSLAGVFYGVNIAVTGIKIKKFNTMLYLMVQQWTGVVVTLITSILLSVIKVNGAPIELIRFSFELPNLLLIVAVALVSSVLCWTFRTYAMKFISATVVSVITPFSAVITGAVSLLSGMDVISFEFVCGGVISLIAVILSAVADMKFDNKKEELKPLTSSNE